MFLFTFFLFSGLINIIVINLIVNNLDLFGFVIIYIQITSFVFVQAFIFGGFPLFFINKLLTLHHSSDFDIYSLQRIAKKTGLTNMEVLSKLPTNEKWSTLVQKFDPPIRTTFVQRSIIMIFIQLLWEFAMIIAFYFLQINSSMDFNFKTFMVSDLALINLFGLIIIQFIWLVLISPSLRIGTPLEKVLLSNNGIYYIYYGSSFVFKITKTEVRQIVVQKVQYLDQHGEPVSDFFYLDLMDNDKLIEDVSRIIPLNNEETINMFKIHGWNVEYNVTEKEFAEE